MKIGLRGVLQLLTWKLIECLASVCTAFPSAGEPVVGQSDQSDQRFNDRSGRDDFARQPLIKLSGETGRILPRGVAFCTRMIGVEETVEPMYGRE